MNRFKEKLLKTINICEIETYGGLAICISNLMEAVRKQAAGDASQEEYILWEFLMSAENLPC